MKESQAAQQLLRLTPPQGVVDAVLDTDTYNEIDDPFALAYLLRSPEAVRLHAIYAAPFHNEKSTGPADGMEKSYQQILHLLSLMGEEGRADTVFRGSTSFLASKTEPVVSPAALDLVARAKAYTAEHPLYVVAIGAVTNIASALLLDEALKERLVVVWLGGHARHWPDTEEFNCAQDLKAAQVLFDSGVPLVQLPCMGVVSGFSVSGPELECYLRGKNALCDYLVEITFQEARDAGPCWSRVIWDVTAAAWLVNRSFLEDTLQPTPKITDDFHYLEVPDRLPMRVVYHVHRDRLLADLVRKLGSVSA